jgi:hypothetical protein
MLRIPFPHTPTRAAVFLSLVFCACCTETLLAADSKPAVANLTVAQIVEKHVAARGGLQAWRAVRTLSVNGTLDAGNGDSVARSERIARRGLGAAARKKPGDAAADAGKEESSQQVQLPFTLDMMRPRKSRLEIQFAGKTAVQVFDGTNGWKLRPYLNRNDVEPFTDEEAKSEASKADLEGPLVDYAAKATKVELAGVEAVDGHGAYELKLTMKNGDVQHIWIDAQSFLDVKVEGISRRLDGHVRNVWIYQRDFRPVQGLTIPFVYESVVEGFTQTHKMTFQSVVVNRTLDESRFTKPRVLVAASPAAAAATAR